MNFGYMWARGYSMSHSHLGTFPNWCKSIFWTNVILLSKCPFKLVYKGYNYSRKLLGTEEVKSGCPVIHQEWFLGNLVHIFYWGLLFPFAIVSSSKFPIFWFWPRSLHVCVGGWSIESVGNWISPFCWLCTQESKKTA